MTLLQLKYIVTVAAAGTISEAAKQLYIAQPSLTSAIKELENELGITIFKRTNKGILLSAEGEEFLGYARQVIEQTNLIEERYLGKTPVKHQFCVSTQHYSFAVEAFVELLKQYGGEEYDFRIPYTQSLEAFTAARVRGIPARLVEFENEAHQVFKPQNSLVWNREFFGWLNKYVK